MSRDVDDVATRSLRFPNACSRRGCFSRLILHAGIGDVIFSHLHIRADSSPRLEMSRSVFLRFYDSDSGSRHKFADIPDKKRILGKPVIWEL
jgi:hypothetical protein